MGRGPFHLTENGALNLVGQIIDEVESVVIEYDTEFPIEVETTFGLQRLISKEVRIAVEKGQFPLILSGNCSSTVGAISGLRNFEMGLFWFDGHADLNTPDTTASGFIDGMSLAMLIGTCWQALTSSIPGFRALPERHVVLVGAREFDKAECDRLNRSEIRQVTSNSIRELGPRGALAPVLSDLSGQLKNVYLHIDMDVHDAKLAPVNPYQSSGGASSGEIQKCVRSISEQFQIVGASITAYDPDCDEDDKGLDAGLALIRLLAEIAKRQVL